MTWPHLNYLAIIVAAVGATLLSGAWYAIFASTMAKLSDAYAGPQSPQPAQLVTVVIRSLVVAFVVAWLVDASQVADWNAALELRVIAWVGFPVMDLGRIGDSRKGAFEARGDSCRRLAWKQGGSG